MELCKFNGLAAISCDPMGDRAKFRRIMQQRCPDMYRCKHCIYIIHDEPMFGVRDMSNIELTPIGCLITSQYKGTKVILTKDNFQIYCDTDGECEAEEIVLEV